MARHQQKHLEIPQIQMAVLAKDTIGLDSSLFTHIVHFHNSNEGNVS